MNDGLYRVTTPYLCAGFVVEGGRVTTCAPILRRKLRYWMTVAEFVSPEGAVAQLVERWSDVPEDAPQGIGEQVQTDSSKGSSPASPIPRST